MGLLAALLSVVCACDKIPELPSFEGEDGNKAVMIDSSPPIPPPSR